MTDVKRSCRSNHPGALDPFRALASIAGLSSPISFETLDDGKNSKLILELHVVAHNPFNDTSVSYHRRGHSGVASAICSTVPESGLWGDDDGVVGANVEGWIDAAAAELSHVAYVEDGDRVKKDPLLKSLVEQFADAVERHLLSTGGTYLVGDSATAADVVVSFLLATSAVRTDATMCQQTLSLVRTVLGNPMVEGFAKVDVKGLKLAEGRQVGVNATTKKASAAAEAKKSAAPAAPSASSGTKGEKESEKPAASPSPATGAPDAAPSGSSYEPVAPSDAGSNPILSKLKSLSVSCDAYRHKLSNTVDELVHNVPLPSSGDKESHTKNLLLKDKKHGLFLVTARSDANTSDTKGIGRALKLEGRTNLRFADKKTLDETLQTEPGCVGPLSVLHDTEKKVTLVFDEDLLKLEKVHCHPGRNDWSVAMHPKELLRAVKEMGHEPVVIPFGGGGGGGGGAEGGSGPAAGKGIAVRPPGAKAPHQQQKQQQQKQKKKGPSENKDKKQGKKGETLLALKWKKDENFAMWYSDVIVLSEMIAYYDISGCYILRPWSYKIWEQVQEWFNVQIRELGVENSYFPLFVSQDRLEKEKDHVEGFAPEVAWVTKSGEDTLAKQIAIRPTSETIMYPAFSDWIKSHRDLPLKLNQWSNVVRWEFKDPTPFLRSREFLWQEGHTAHATYEEADVMVMQALNLYRRVYEDLLAVPVIKGYKTEKEKFAGGHQTTTVEAYIPSSGRAIQGATSHNLGQNFGKMFDITFQDEKGESQIAWQTSWGLTTRTIGVMVMVHGDDNGLVMPPRVSPLQVVIIPIVSKKCPMESAGPYCEKVLNDLVSAGIRAKYDDRLMYNPGWKYNHWEQKGVPIRIEVGPRDMEQSQVRVVTRYSGAKEDISIDGIGECLQQKLDSIQNEMFEKAKKERDAHVVKVTEWKDVVPNLELNNLVLTPWIGGQHQDWEEWVKNKSREESLKEGDVEDARCATSVAAKSLCIPFEQPELPEGTKCIASGEAATCWILWGRSY